MTERKDKVWQQARIAQRFLKGVRGGIPLADQQIDIMLRIIKATVPTPASVLDLGCGNGVLGRAIHAVHPTAQYTFADFSQPMLEAASAELPASDHVTYVQADFGIDSWVESVAAYAPFDAVVSGYAIHHSPDERKKVVYQQVYDLLSPGGVFIHTEHVAPASSLTAQLHNEYFVDSLYQFHKAADPNISYEDIYDEYSKRSDERANQLTLVELQCEWLREIGFTDVDTFLKVFELAIFGGVKP